MKILSPSTRRTDQVFTRSKDEDAGVEASWLVDADLAEPSIVGV